MSAAVLEILDKIKHLSQEEQDLVLNRLTIDSGGMWVDRPSLEEMRSPAFVRSAIEDDIEFRAQRDPLKVRGAIEAAENGTSQGVVFTTEEIRILMNLPPFDSSSS